MRAIIYIVDYGTRNRLGVAQLVARYLGVVEAVGSSPVTQTSKTTQFLVDCVVFIFSQRLDKNAPYGWP